MFSKFRAVLLAGALVACAQAAQAEPITLADALSRGADSSPRVSQAKAQADAAEARARQAGVSPNPELSLEVENFAGSGAFQGLRSTETTLALSQRIELGGKRSARVGVASAERDFAFLTYKRRFGRSRPRYSRCPCRTCAPPKTGRFWRATIQRQPRNCRAPRKSLSKRVATRRCAQLRAEATLAEAKAEQARTFGELLIARRLAGNADWQRRSRPFGYA